MTQEQIVEALQDRKLTQVAKATGLSYDTVWRLANNKSPNVAYQTIVKLNDYLQVRS